MSETKKLIHDLNVVIDFIHHERAFSFWTDKIVGHLIQVRKIVKQQAQPGDLVEKILETLGQFINLKGQHKGRDAFEKELRKLLQSRQPGKASITKARKVKAKIKAVTSHSRVSTIPAITFRRLCTLPCFFEPFAAIKAGIYMYQILLTILPKDIRLLLSRRLCPVPWQE